MKDFEAKKAFNVEKLNTV